MRLLGNIILLAFCLGTLNSNAQLMASSKSFDLGTIDQMSAQSISIPIKNQTRNKIRCVPRGESANMTGRPSDAIRTHEEGFIHFNLLRKSSKKINESFYLYASKFSDPIKIKIKAKVVDYGRAKCPEFEVKSIKYKQSKEQTKLAGKQTSIILTDARDQDKLYTADPEEIPYGHLVVLIDASVSMQSNQRLKLMKTQLSEIVSRLRPSDYISIVMYNHRSKIVLEKVSCRDKAMILDEISAIKPHGYTNGQVGIERALTLSERTQVDGVKNHVILLTDGAFNFGKDADGISNLLEERQKQFDFKLSVISVMSTKSNSMELKSLTKTGNGHFFQLGQKKIVGNRLFKMLKTQLS